MVAPGAQHRADGATPIRVVIVTMDTHVASATVRAQAALKRDLPGLELSVHAASEWSADPRLPGFPRHRHQA